MPIMWPAALPQRPDSSSWSRTGKASRWTFEPDSGMAYARPSGRKGDVMNVSFVMTPEQAKTFRAWFHDVLMEGTLCFSYFDPDSGSDLTVRFDPSASDAYSITALGLQRNVSMSWEVMPE